MSDTPTPPSGVSPRQYRNLLLLISSVFMGTTAVSVSGDWRIDLLVVGAALCGMFWRASPDTDGDKVPDVVESVWKRVLKKLAGSAVLLLATSSLHGCSHWSGNLNEARIEANGSGEIVWERGEGVSADAGFDASAAMIGEVCYRKRCVPVTLTITGDSDPVTGIKACLTVWGVQYCRTAP